MAVSCGSERGSALLATLALASITIALVAAVAAASRTAARNVGDRENALCARYAALAGIALGAAAGAQGGVVSPRVSALRVTTRHETAGACLRRATAVCGNATRTVERIVACDP